MSLLGNVVRADMALEPSYGERNADPDYLPIPIEQGSWKPYGTRDFVTLPATEGGKFPTAPSVAGESYSGSLTAILSPAEARFAKWATMPQLNGIPNPLGSFPSISIEAEEGSSSPRAYRGVIPRSVRFASASNDPFLKMGLTFLYLKREDFTLYGGASPNDISIPDLVAPAYPWLMKNAYLERAGEIVVPLDSFEFTVDHGWYFDHGAKKLYQIYIDKNHPVVNGRCRFQSFGVAAKDDQVLQDLFSGVGVHVAVTFVHPESNVEITSSSIQAGAALVPVADLSDYTVDDAVMIEGDDDNGVTRSEVLSVVAKRSGAQDYIEVRNEGTRERGTRHQYASGSTIFSKALGISAPAAFSTSTFITKPHSGAFDLQFACEAADEDAFSIGLMT